MAAVSIAGPTIVAHLASHRNDPEGHAEMVEAVIVARIAAQLRFAEVAARIRAEEAAGAV